MSDPASKHPIDRLVTLAHLGAVRAAEAYAQLAGEPIHAVEPVLLGRVEGGTSSRPESSMSGDEGVASTAVVFEFDGCLDALVGILFPEPSREALVRRIVCLEEGPLAPEIVESALMEVGNILASHVASAIADRLGDRLLPSIPSIEMEAGDEALAELVLRSVDDGVLWIESALVDEAGALRGRLVLVPTGDSRPPESARAAALGGL